MPETTHGASLTAEYRAWQGMRARCGDARVTGWENYGARGIQVCERWESFKNFLSDMGPRPSPKHTLDRINNNGNYEPSNCRWATRYEQAQNRRSNVVLECRGEKRTVTEWGRHLGIPPARIFGRLARGMSIERALSTQIFPTRRSA